MRRTETNTPRTHGPIPSSSISAAAIIILSVIMAAALIGSFLAPELPQFQRPQLARIFFWHFPCPIISSVLIGFGAWFSFFAVKTTRLEWDVRAESVLELGFIFGILTMITGMLMSRVQWGAWWQWDPRQTSYLLLLVLYAAYFVFRGAYTDPVRRAVYSGAYALAMTLPAYFLEFIFPRLPQVEKQSFHPTNTIMSGQVHGSYAIVIMMTLTVMSALTFLLYRLRMKVGLLELLAYEHASN